MSKTNSKYVKKNGIYYCRVCYNKWTMTGSDMNEIPNGYKQHNSIYPHFNSKHGDGSEDNDSSDTVSDEEPLTSNDPEFTDEDFMNYSFDLEIKRPNGKERKVFRIESWDSKTIIGGRAQDCVESVVMPDYEFVYDDEVNEDELCYYEEQKLYTKLTNILYHYISGDKSKLIFILANNDFGKLFDICFGKNCVIYKRKLLSFNGKSVVSTDIFTSPFLDGLTSEQEESRKIYNNNLLQNLITDEEKLIPKPWQKTQKYIYKMMSTAWDAAYDIINFDSFTARLPCKKHNEMCRHVPDEPVIHDLILTGICLKHGHGLEINKCKEKYDGCPVNYPSFTYDHSIVEGGSMEFKAIHKTITDSKPVSNEFLIQIEKYKPSGGEANMKCNVEWQDSIYKHILKNYSKAHHPLITKYKTQVNEDKEEKEIEERAIAEDKERKIQEEKDMDIDNEKIKELEDLLVKLKNKRPDKKL